MNRNVYCCYAYVKPYQWSHLSPISNIISLIFNSIFFFLLISQLIVIVSPTFPSLLLVYFPTTIYLNITFPLSIYLPLIWLFIFPSFYYKFTILSLILYIVFHKQKTISLSFSLSQNFVFHFLVEIVFSCIFTLG